MSHAVGSLVKCRGREWVVLPDSQDDPDLLILRPLGGTDDEVCGIYLPLEKVETASFDLPDPAAVGDHLSCRLLRDAVRLGFQGKCWTVSLIWENRLRTSTLPACSVDDGASPRPGAALDRRRRGYRKNG
jgi:hypothetical protein